MVARPDFKEKSIREHIVNDPGALERIGDNLHAVELVGFTFMLLGKPQGKRELVLHLTGFSCLGYTCLLGHEQQGAYGNASPYHFL
jgi:hypothetical protein